MDCHLHAGVPATATCAGCAESFCANCVVTIKGATYCASCKGMAVTAVAPPIVAQCAEAKSALNTAIVGIFFFGFILEPMAIAKAVKARQLLAVDPSLGGRGKATAALIISITALLLWLIGIFMKIGGQH